MAAVDTNTSAKSTAATEPELSRDQIAASLGARDPSWFKQTADRGLGNAAYRKSKEDDLVSDINIASGRRGLPGLSQEAQSEPARERSPTPPETAYSESVYSDTLSRSGSLLQSNTPSSRFSTARTSTSTKPDLKALIAEDAEQEKAAPVSDQTSSTSGGEHSSLGRTLTMSSSQSRIANSAERPASPTKGTGGFVQSAMMKRSDSASKRSTTQNSSTIDRQNSVASSKSGYGGLQGSHSMPRLEPTTKINESGVRTLAKPSSSSSNLTKMMLAQDAEESDVSVKPNLPNHGRSKSVASTYSTTADEGHTSPPSSPSKRWSPTKSSWLESAISRPESPKPTSARNSQPSWMADIAKTKAQKASAEGTPNLTQNDDSRPSSPIKAPFGQGMLTPRSGTPKLLEGLNPRSSSPSKVDRVKDSFERVDTSNATPPSQTTTSSVDSRPRTAAPVNTDLQKSKDEDMETAVSAVSITKPEKTMKVAADTKTPEPSTSRVTPSTLATKSKPDTPRKPQTDFRSNLRARPATEAKPSDTPEFLSKFGNLKKTQTQNYVAPDVLKDNILRGKSDLAKTHGPVKLQRKDELKESLLAKKEQWKDDKAKGIVHERKVSGPPQTPQKPEALAKRELLSKAELMKASTDQEKPTTATPEALARHKSLREKPNAEAALPGLQKQTSAPANAVNEVAPSPSKNLQAVENSKMAARFNPALAGILARGPPAPVNKSNDESKPSSQLAIPNTLASSSTPSASAASESMTDGGQLQDVRKGRAKGPKKRKGAATTQTEDTMTTSMSTKENGTATENVVPPVIAETQSKTQALESAPSPKAKPRALPGSAASVMMASLPKTSTPQEAPVTSTTQNLKTSSSQSNIGKPTTPIKSLGLASTNPTDQRELNAPQTPMFGTTPDSSTIKLVGTPSAQKNDIPEFKGFSSAKQPRPTPSPDDNKENFGSNASSVKSVASNWAKQNGAMKNEPPAQIQLPSRKDEEAAMRSAGLLASTPSRPGSSNGLGTTADQQKGNLDTPPLSASLPPQKPLKPSRSVSGQLQESSSNQGTSNTPQVYHQCPKIGFQCSNIVAHH